MTSAPEPTQGLTVERYAEVLAHTVFYGAPAKSEVLARLGVDEAAWAATEAHWTATFVQEALEDAHPAMTAFALYFAPVLRQLKLDKPPLTSIGADPRRDAPPSSEPPDALTLPLPSYLLAGAARSPRAAWTRWEAGAERKPDAERPMPALTAELDVGAMGAAVLPDVWGWLADDPETPGESAASKRRPVEDDAGTRELQEADLISNSDPDPFSPESTTASEPIPPPPLGGTAEVVLPLPARALPFDVPTEPLWRVEHPARPLAKGDPNAATVAQMEGGDEEETTDRDAAPTVEIDLADVEQLLGAGAPLVGSRADVERPPSGPPASPRSRPDVGAESKDQMPLEIYAAITAALAGGGRREDVLLRHALTEEQFTREARGWAVRFQEVPELVARFMTLVREGSR